MATTGTSNSEPITAEELQRILSNRRIRNKGAHVAGMVRHREIAMQDAASVIEILLLLVQQLQPAALALPSTAKPADRRSAQRDYAILLCVIHYLKLWQGQRHEVMEEEIQQTQELAEEIEDWRTVVFCISNQAWILAQRGEVQESLRLQRAGVTIARKHGLPNATIAIYLNNIVHLLYTHLQDPHQALGVSDEVLDALAVGEHSTLAICNAFDTRGRVLLQLKRIEEGMRMLNAAQQIAFEAGQDDLGIRSALEIIARWYSVEEYTLALEHSRRIESFNPAAISPTRMGELLCAVGRVMIQLSELEIAHEKLATAETLAKNINRAGLRYQIEMAIGMLHLAQGNGAEAEQRTRNAIAIVERHKLRPAAHCAALVQLGESYGAQGEIPEAEQAYQQALLIATEHQHISSIIASHRLLGNLKEKLGQIAEAKSHYHHVLETPSTIQAHQNAMLATERLAELAKSEGNFPEALEYHERHHAICRQVDKRHQNNRLTMLRVYYRIDELEEKAQRERTEKEHAHNILNSTQNDLDGLRVALIEHQHQVKTLRSRLQIIMANMEQEKGERTFRELRSLTREIDGSVGTEQAHWQTNLRGTNKEFHRRLLKHHPTLSPALTLLCDCIHSGMTTDTILSLLHISPDALNKRRHRLRKMLQLSPNQKLDEYLQGL
ncbi:MAG: hypothetical protein IT211_00605 [Armatimonadetes bacterium]|nr:hypothetical protein [Armatimonadota bacterium]